jgi:hypothetical protein
MKTPLHAGTVIETTTPHELQQHLEASNMDFFRERARGVQPWRYESQPVTVAAAAVKLPAGADNKCGPNVGFCVMVHKLRVQGLASGDVLSVYRNSTSTVPVEQFVMGATGTVSVINPGSRGLFLNSDDRLIFQGAGLTATDDIIVSGEGTECGAPDAWKLLS